MYYIISYDIPDDRRRAKLAKTLKDFGDRVQYSVFEDRLDQTLYNKMVRRIREIMESKEDRVRIYCLCGSCEANMQIYGQGTLIEDHDVYIL